MTFILTAMALFRRAVPFVQMVPRWVWVAGAVLVGVLIYGHSVANRVRAEKDAEYNQKLQVEVTRQHDVAAKAISSATERALTAEQRAQKLEEDLEHVKTTGVDRVCLPKPVTDQLRSLSKGRRRP